MKLRPVHELILERLQESACAMNVVESRMENPGELSSGRNSISPFELAALRESENGQFTVLLYLLQNSDCVPAEKLDKVIKVLRLLTRDDVMLMNTIEILEKRKAVAV